MDRYGQEKTPYILYLVNQSGNMKIKGNMRILELLIAHKKEMAFSPKKKGHFDIWLPGPDSNQRQGG